MNNDYQKFKRIFKDEKILQEQILSNLLFDLKSLQLQFFQY